MINSTAVRIRRMALFLAVQLLLLFPLTNLMFGQAQTSAVPRLVKFSGTVNDGHESPRTGIMGLTFALYKDEQGGVPLWLETQNVALGQLAATTLPTVRRPYHSTQRAAETPPPVILP